MSDTDVLVVGAGPVGLTAACELARRGVACRIIDTLEDPPQYAKAVGVQPRTLEIWEDMGFAEEALAASTPMRGQVVYVNGEEASRMETELPPEIPFPMVSLPQYETERLLREQLDGYGVEIERGVSLTALTQDEDGVTATLATPSGEQTVRAGYLVGGDGAHSVTRHELGLGFEGDAFAEQYMLGDVVVDWSLPPGFAIRVLRRGAEEGPDLGFVAIPLPGDGRYRISMNAAEDLLAKPDEGDEVRHGLDSSRPAPTLEHIQAVLDELSPEPTKASNLRWSSVFGISHRLVDRYSVGRVFVAGDAAHVHPPTGAQGMNTGIQDSYNLAWKLALAVQGKGAADLLESYHAERHPIGEEIVGRTTADTKAQFLGPDKDDKTTALLRDAQLLLGYPDSPIVGEDVDGEALAAGPRPGQRAPDARGLEGDGGSRLFELLRGVDPVLVLYAEAGTDMEALAAAAAEASAKAQDSLTVLALLAPDAGDPPAGLAGVRDGDGEFKAAYDATGGCAYLIRPDGYVGYRTRLGVGPAACGAPGLDLRLGGLVRFGIVILPEHRWEQGRHLWRRAEEYGFDHAWTYDHLGWRDLVDGPWFGAIPTLTAAATVTSKIGLGTLVASANFRHPAAFAREVTTLDDVSGGRLLLGLGAGGKGFDAEVLGQDDLTGKTRTDRYIEFVTLLDRILTNERTDFEGDYFTAVDARSKPGSLQSPRVPFVVSGNFPRSIALAARLGDGWITTGPQADDLDSWWAGVAENAARLDEALAAEGRPPEAVARYLLLDAAPVFSLSSVDAFADFAGRSEELGFTDAVTHWPRPKAGTRARKRSSKRSPTASWRPSATSARTVPRES